MIGIHITTLLFQSMTALIFCYIFVRSQKHRNLRATAHRLSHSNGERQRHLSLSSWPLVGIGKTVPCHSLQRFQFEMPGSTRFLKLSHLGARGSLCESGQLDPNARFCWALPWSPQGNSICFSHSRTKTASGYDCTSREFWFSLRFVLLYELYTVWCRLRSSRNQLVLLSIAVEPHFLISSPSSKEADSHQTQIVTTIWVWGSASVDRFEGLKGAFHNRIL